MKKIITCIILFVLAAFATDMTIYAYNKIIEANEKRELSLNQFQQFFEKDFFDFEEILFTNKRLELKNEKYTFIVTHPEFNTFETLLFDNKSKKILEKNSGRLCILKEQWAFDFGKKLFRERQSLGKIDLITVNQVISECR